MIYEYPFWEEVLTEIDGLESLDITLTEIDYEIDGLESLDELNFNLIELIELENLTMNDGNVKRKKIIMLD
jgi:hypothetical protein